MLHRNLFWNLKKKGFHFLGKFEDALKYLHPLVDLKKYHQVSFLLHEIKKILLIETCILYFVFFLVLLSSLEAKYFLLLQIKNISSTIFK